MKTKTLFFTIFFITTNLYSQDWKLGGNTDAGPPGIAGLLTNSNFLGGTQTANVILGTGGVPRIFIGGTAFANPGFVGIATPNPLMPLHVQGSGAATALGWTKGILLSDFSTLMWLSNTNSRNFFMAHPSSAEKNFFEGVAVGIGSGAPVDYSPTVWASSCFSSPTCLI